MKSIAAAFIFFLTASLSFAQQSQHEAQILDLCLNAEYWKPATDLTSEVSNQPWVLAAYGDVQLSGDYTNHSTLRVENREALVSAGNDKFFDVRVLDIRGSEATVQLVYLVKGAVLDAQLYREGDEWKMRESSVVIN